MASSNAKEQSSLSIFDKEAETVMENLRRLINSGNTKIEALEKELSVSEEDRRFSARSSEAQSRHTTRRISKLENELLTHESLKAQLAEKETELQAAREEAQQQK